LISPEDLTELEEAFSALADPQRRDALVCIAKEVPAVAVGPGRGGTRVRDTRGCSTGVDAREWRSVRG